VYLYLPTDGLVEAQLYVMRQVITISFNSWLLHFYRNFFIYQNQVLGANATGLPQTFEQDELLSNMVQFSIYYIGRYYDITLCVYLI